MTGAAQCRRVGLARGLHGSEAVLPLGIVTVASIALAVVAHVGRDAVTGAPRGRSRDSPLSDVVRSEAADPAVGEASSTSRRRSDRRVVEQYGDVLHGSEVTARCSISSRGLWAVVFAENRR